jgi:hypothetical protein
MSKTSRAIPMIDSRSQANTCPQSDEHRSERVKWLLFGIVMLSIADLALTLSYLTTVGMSEGNPIAVWLLQATNSVWSLAAYKALTVTICVSLLYRTRFQRESELAAWCGMLILVALSVWWNQYSRYQPNLPMGLDHIVMVGDTLERPMIPTNSKRYLVQ